MTAPVDPRQVCISVQGTALSAAYMLDDGTPPQLASGFGGWQDQQRDRRRALPMFTGPASWTQVISVVLNAYGEGRDAAIAGVRNQWNVLQALWTIPTQSDPPPLATLEGKALMLPGAADPNRNWALTDVASREILRASGSDGVNAVRGSGEPVTAGAGLGELVRWAGTLTFTHVAPRQVLRITQGPNAGRRMHVVMPGETLKMIARSEDADIAKIRRANGKLIRDPQHARVKVGETLWLPPRKKGKK